MAGVFKRNGIRIPAAVMAIALAVSLCACSDRGKQRDEWLENAALDAEETPEELYEKALKEDILVVYSVSTRVTQTKDAFEAAYPGLSVEVKDMRSPNLIETVVENYESGRTDCDVILCNDNSGDFKDKVADKGIAVPYIPASIKPKLKEGSTGGMTSFLNEAELLFYNGSLYDSCPIENIWELTEEKYAGRIYMPNPLHSFSTYAFCGATFENADALAKAFRDYSGEELSIPGGSSAAQVFWEKVSPGIVFTNSSDEVMEAIGTGEADFGIMVSSKMRYKSLGYDMEPVNKLEPFSGCKTSFSVMIARNSKNINTAKLFIYFLMGEENGKGEGYKPFSTDGTWSVRVDVPDGSGVSMENMDLLTPDQDYLIENRSFFEEFWKRMISGT